METAANEAGGVRGAFGALSAPRTGLEPLRGREGLRKPGLLGTELHEFNHQTRRLFPPLMTVQFDTAWLDWNPDQSLPVSRQVFDGAMRLAFRTPHFGFLSSACPP